MLRMENDSAWQEVVLALLSQVWIDQSGLPSPAGSVGGASHLDLPSVHSQKMPSLPHLVPMSSLLRAQEQQITHHDMALPVLPRSVGTHGFRRRTGEAFLH